ncbi:MAG: tat pathway signal sequence [Mycolicibacterium sp.]|nr:tat pathway signal sequence [Mycolicibacterium sp.]
MGCAGLAAPPAATADDLRTRIAAADAYLATRPGSVGYVLTDRATGATYRNAHAGELVWTASTIKLAMVVDLLTRARAGSIALTNADRTQMSAMMHSSDDDAADALWSKFGGPDHTAYNAAFPRYGMTDLQPQKGFSSIYPYWGFQKATANDLDRLINYVLTRLDPAQRAAIVYELQNVAPNQQWGVWGAGPAMAPGNKDGWSLEQGGWVTNSVGFAGAGQRYTLAMMNSLSGAGGYDDGVATTSRLAEILLSGLQSS